MNNTRKKFIKDRKYAKRTEYYTCGHLINIPSVGQFPRLIKKDETDEEMDSTFILSAITADFVYYLDQEVDNIEQALMVNRKYQLVSDNYLAYNDLTELVATNASFLWLSKEVKYWQKEEYTQPELLTPDIKKIFHQVHIEKLSKEERNIYFAFLNNGPVKYTKPQSLMAVLSNCDIFNQFSDQVKTLMALIKSDDE